MSKHNERAIDLIATVIEDYIGWRAVSRHDAEQTAERVLDAFRSAVREHPELLTELGLEQAYYCEADGPGEIVSECEHPVGTTERSYKFPVFWMLSP